MSVEAFLAEKAAKTDEALDAYLKRWEGVPQQLEEAIRYGLFGGGKRLRPALALGTAELVCGNEDVALPLACALEMIHTYSLIHDDLPAMDDDDLRRGKPSSHVVYGEATAILAGDGLLTMAFDVLADADNMSLVRDVARAAGVAGMVGGQKLDLDREGVSTDLEGLKEIHSKKTGALIRVSVSGGALLGGAPDGDYEALCAYGEHVGLAFQIRDDVLDVEGDEGVMGKPAGSDEAQRKSTYPSLMGVEASQRLARDAMDGAVTALAGFGNEASMLRELARYAVERRA